MNKKLSFFKNPVFLIILILALALALRLHNLNTEDFELAESFRFIEANTLASSFYVTLNYEEHPPLYNIFLHFWRYVGESVFVLRLSSVLFGVGAVLLIYLIGKKIFDYKVGLVAALILALNPLHLNYSQNIEPYSFTVFFSFLAIYFLIRALGSNQFKHWSLFVISIVIAGYADHFILFLLIAITLAVVLSYKAYRTKIKSLILSGVAISILFIPNIFIGLFQFTFLGESSGFAQLRHPLWYLLIIPLNFVTLNIGMRSIFLDANNMPVKNILLLLLLVGIILFFSIFFVKGTLPFKENREKKIFLLSCLFVPVLSIYFMSFFTFMFIDPNRFLFISFPFFILAAKGITSVKSKKIFSVLIMLLLIIGSVQVYSHFQQHKTKITAITSKITADYESGDVVAVYPQQYLPTLWYYLPENIPATSFPVHFPLNTYKKYQRHDYNIEKINEATIPLFIEYQDNLSKNYSRLWYVVHLSRVEKSKLDKEEFILDLLTNNYPLILEEKSPDGLVGLYLFELS